MFKNILIPTDGSKLSQKAVVQGVALAKAVGAKVTAFFAAPPATPIVYRNSLPVGYATPNEHKAMIEKTAAQYLAFVERYAPDPVTADIARRARVDEARHVAFGVEHARHYLGADPDRAGELRAAVERRAEYLADASGQSPHVEEALVVLAAGHVTPGRIREGVLAVRGLHETMHRRRVARLRQLGFPPATAEEISEMHTPNFM